MLKPLTNRLANLNVSVAETGYQDRRHMAEIACAAVASDRTVAESTIRAVDSLIETTDGGTRFTFNDRIEFPYGPFGSVIGWFAQRQAKATGTQVLAELKRLAEAQD